MDPLHEFERQRRESHQRVRAIIAEGNPLIAAEFDKNMRDIETGVTHARNIWHSISPAQRRDLALIDAVKLEKWNLPTLRNLRRRGLITTDLDVKITEHGRFVLKFGPPSPASAARP